MSKLIRLYKKHQRAAYVAEKRFDEMCSAIRPIMNFFMDANGLGIESLEFYGKEAIIKYSWSCRGCESTDELSMPRTILESDDPAKAAEDYIAELKERRKQKAEIDKAVEIEKLKIRLAALTGEE